jgi:hypothetical protein
MAHGIFMSRSGKEVVMSDGTLVHRDFSDEGYQLYRDLYNRMFEGDVSAVEEWNQRMHDVETPDG